MVHVTSKMSTKDFIEKVAKIFNVRKELIYITYIHPFNTDDAEQVKVEIEERDPTSLHHAINVLKDFSKLTMDSLHYRPNFNPGKINKIFYHCSIEHLKISRIAKFGGEML